MCGCSNERRRLEIAMFFRLYFLRDSTPPLSLFLPLSHILNSPFFFYLSPSTISRLDLLYSILNPPSSLLRIPVFLHPNITTHTFKISNIHTFRFRYQLGIATATVFHGEEPPALSNERKAHSRHQNSFGLHGRRLKYRMAHKGGPTSIKISV